MALFVRTFYLYCMIPYFSDHQEQFLCIKINVGLFVMYDLSFVSYLASNALSRATTDSSNWIINVVPLCQCAVTLQCYIWRKRHTCTNVSWNGSEKFHFCTGNQEFYERAKHFLLTKLHPKRISSTIPEMKYAQFNPPNIKKAHLPWDYP